MPGKNAQEKENTGLLHTMSVSPANLQLWWESSGHWPRTAPVKWEKEWGCETMGSKRRFGPELLSVELIDLLQAHALMAALYLCYPQHRLPSSNDWHEIQTNFSPLQVAINRTVIFQSSTKSIWWREKSHPKYHPFWEQGKAGAIAEMCPGWKTEQNLHWEFMVYWNKK